jgi:hypothetical protein
VLLKETSIDVTQTDAIKALDSLTLKSVWLLGQIIKTQYQSGKYLEAMALVDDILGKLGSMTVSDTTLSDEEV